MNILRLLIPMIYILIKNQQVIQKILEESGLMDGANAYGKSDVKKNLLQ